MMTTKIPFIVHCGDCNYEWPAFWSPMPFSDAAEIVESLRCPMCAADGMRIFCGPAHVDEINISSERVKNNGES